MPGPDPLVGRRFYDFIVDRKLAQGGMGAVYLLRHEQYPIRKVLKVILAEYANRPEIRERFEREAHAVASLKHPNIAKIDSVGTIDDQPCMLIPFLEGRPLDEYLIARGGRLPAHEALHIATQIARGLHHAHGEGIIHRDLKPGNVFVEPTEDDPLAVQVLDFGIAKQLKMASGPALGSMSGPLGTPAYMAVEQFEHAADVTPAADVWALAIIVWEMVTGRRPWTAEDAHVLYHKQLTEPPEPPVVNTLPATWEDFLRRALTPNPRLRPQSMPALVVPLALALPGGVDVLRKVAPRWLEESGAEPKTPAIFSPPPAPPVWSSGRASGAEQRLALSTTLGSASGVLAPRSAAATRWRLLILGLAVALPSSVGVYAIAGRGDHRDAAAHGEAAQPSAPPPLPPRAEPAPPPATPASAPVPMPVEPSTATQTETSVAVPAANTDPPGAAKPFAPRPRANVVAAPPSGSSVPPSEPTKATMSQSPAPRGSTAKQTPTDTRDPRRSSASPSTPGVDGPSAATKSPAATTRPRPERSRQEPAEGSARKFDPNDVGGH